MNRIDKLFGSKRKNILNIYCTAGFPEIDSLQKIILSLQNNGVDIIEVGMPYSDPLADGPVIQESNMKALGNGMHMNLLFKQLKQIKDQVKIPMILMGYLNPVMQFGFERFCREASESGIDGLILPDLPMFEYVRDHKETVEKYGLYNIFLITPETTEERIRKIDSLSSGFIYAVSSSSTTGKDTDISGKEKYFERIRSMDLINPVLVGFGIRDKQTFSEACKHTNGAIIGSAYIKALQGSSDIEEVTKQFVNGILN